MHLAVSDHALVAARLTALRDETTPTVAFRGLVDQLVTLLAHDATRSLAVAPWRVTTPVAPVAGVRLDGPAPLLVPVLRAGLGMLTGMHRALPEADVGFLGMVRDEVTLQATTYAERLPADLGGRPCFVLDPMLATGGTLAASLAYLLDRGAGAVVAVCLLAAPEGIARLEAEVGGADVTLVVGAVDERLDERGYIVPGLGDAGDRLFGPGA